MLAWLEQHWWLLAGATGGTIWFLLYLNQSRIPPGWPRWIIGLPDRKPGPLDKLFIAAMLIFGWLAIIWWLLVVAPSR